jgi:hypothetical protein
LGDSFVFVLSNKAIMVPINAANMIMIIEIMNGGGTNSMHETRPKFMKYSNTRFDIIVQNNKSIVVIDKYNPVTVYSDLITAYIKIKGSLS